MDIEYLEGGKEKVDEALNNTVTQLRRIMNTSLPADSALITNATLRNTEQIDAYITVVLAWQAGTPTPAQQEYIDVFLAQIARRNALQTAITTITDAMGNIQELSNVVEL